MLEESFKAIEGPIARRKTQARRTWPDGTVYYPFNLAGEVAKRATSEVLYTDALVCEDAIRYKKDFCRTPTDYEKYYNVIQTAACEAVEECMGVPTDATVVTAEAFSGLSIVIETRWGLTSSITPNMGFVQGSVSGSEQAKPAQSQILALRAVSKAFYLTSKGRKVHAAGFVDDTEHYGKGALDLASILRELSLGSIATGIGYAWPKFSAFASDWDKAVDVVGHPFTPSGIHASGWDIWKGGTLTAVVPRAKMDTIEKLFGKI